MDTEKKPRQYARAIIDSKDRNERRRMLYAVPDKYKDWVRKLVESHFAKRKSQKKS